MNFYLKLLSFFFFILGIDSLFYTFLLIDNYPCEICYVYSSFATKESIEYYNTYPFQIAFYLILGASFIIIGLLIFTFLIKRFNNNIRHDSNEGENDV